MTLYHVTVEQDGDWYIGRVLERGGITTQGRTLEELIFMLRDAIALMWDETEVELELLVSSSVSVPDRQRAWAKRASA